MRISKTDDGIFKYVRKSISVISLIIAMFYLTSCQSILNLTYKNKEFDYIKNGEISKIVIQSTRDKGFRFVVTDPDTIKELYDSLSGAMPVTEKNPLNPDYIFEFHKVNSEIKKYYYVAGMTEKESRGNLYDEKTQYLVMNRIDNMLIKNLNALRKPTSFYEAYYISLLSGIKAVKADYPAEAISIIISEDKEMLKYQMSYELMNFQENLKEFGAVLMDSEENTKDGELIIKVETQGYKTDLYKAVFDVKIDGAKMKKKYYIKSQYINDKWETVITGEKPKDW